MLFFNNYFIYFYQEIFKNYVKFYYFALIYQLVFYFIVYENQIYSLFLKFKNKNIFKKQNKRIKSTSKKQKYNGIKGCSKFGENNKARVV